MVCCHVWSRNFVNEKSLVQWGAVAPNNKITDNDSPDHDSANFYGSVPSSTILTTAFHCFLFSTNWLQPHTLFVMIHFEIILPFISILSDCFWYFVYSYFSWFVLLPSFHLHPYLMIHSDKCPSIYVCLWIPSASIS